jgi:HlyD family secretion protein
MNEEEKIELRSEEVQEILGKPPVWMIRWGITVIFMVIVALLLGSYWFKYPHIISAPVVVTTENLPASILARMPGRIDTFFIEDKQMVMKDQYLGVIENPANTADIFALSDELNDFQKFFIDYDISGIYLPKNMRSLGDLQTSYFSFIQGIADYRYFIETDYCNKKIRSLRSQIETQQNICRVAENQIVIQEKQSVTVTNIFERDSILYTQGAISLEEYERSKNALLQSEYALESARNSLHGSKISVQQLEQNIFDLQQQNAEKRTQLQLAIIGAYDNLKNQIAVWEQTYLFKSPIEGQVTFTQYWQRNQNVQAGSVILTVVPPDSLEIIGKIMLPAAGAGRVKTGQKVHIKFDNYPHMEFGMVDGIVNNISLVPVINNAERFYMVEVELPNNLQTNYKKELDFSQEMQGTADIITEDIRLIERFLNPIKSLIKRNNGWAGE